MIATATMWYSICKIGVAEVKYDNEIEMDSPIPFWFCAAPVVVDILSFYFIAQGLSG